MSGYDPQSESWGSPEQRWGTPPGQWDAGQQPGWGAPPEQWGQGQPQWGPPPGYGTPYYWAPQTDGKAIGAMVSAILAFVLCPVIPAIVALVLASQSQRDIAASRGRLTGDGFNKAARIIAWVHFAYMGVMLLIVFAMIGSGV